MLAYSEVIFYSEVMEDKEAKKFNDSLISSAYVAWLTTNTKKNRFKDYLKLLGLAEKTPVPNEEQQKMLNERTDDLVERIMRADKERKL